MPIDYSQVHTNPYHKSASMQVGVPFLLTINVAVQGLIDVKYFGYASSINFIGCADLTTQRKKSLKRFLDYTDQIIMKIL